MLNLHVEDEVEAAAKEGRAREGRVWEREQRGRERLRLVRLRKEKDQRARERERERLMQREHVQMGEKKRAENSKA